MGEEKNEKLVDFQVYVRKYKTQLTPKFKLRKPYEVPNINHIKSYIPGTIIKINVKKGQKVKEGQSLLVLEAMKMMNQIAMPFDGKIKDIHVKVGEKIPKNFLMIEIE